MTTDTAEQKPGGTEQMPDSQGGDLFIVDNSISGWTGLRYLKDWAEFATSFDVAPGFFEIGSLLELDGKWQKLDKSLTLTSSPSIYGGIKSKAPLSWKRPDSGNVNGSPIIKHTPNG